MRLPTEAEWEYAARAGSTDSRYGDLDAIGWFKNNSGRQMHSVGQKQANAWRLYDMLGNVMELTADWYAGSLSELPSRDPLETSKPFMGSRVLRGPGWESDAKYVKVWARGVSVSFTGRDTGVGFRCVGDMP